MSRSCTAFALVIGALLMVGAQCGQRPPRPAARVPSTAPGSCDGIVNYADELTGSDFRLAWTRQLGSGMVEIDVSFQLQNEGPAVIVGATATPDFSAAADLGVLTEPAPLPADFGAIAPLASARSTAPLRIRLPAAQVTPLLERLADGTISFVIHAEEENVLAPNTELREWSATEDRMYAIASNPAGGYGTPPNVDPGPGPFDPDQRFTIAFVELLDDVETVFDDFDPALDFFVSTPEGFSPVNLPDAYAAVRVIDAERLDDAGDGITAWLVTIQRTGAEPLPEIFSTASFCTSDDQWIDLPIQESQLQVIDGLAVDWEPNPQAIRFNDIPLAGGLVALSGQVAGQVLRPSLAISLRDGRVVARGSVEAELAVNAELRAEEQASFDEDLELWTFCYPVSALRAGPVYIEMAIEVVHRIGAEGSIGAGAVVGFEKRLAGGVRVECEGGPDVAESCDAEPIESPTPLQFTPPQLTDDTAASARVETTIDTTLVIGEHQCEDGARLRFEAAGYGQLDVTPTQDPWWSVGYGLDKALEFELDLHGLGIEPFGLVFPSFEPGPVAPDPAVRTSGEDQRWSVAIDELVSYNGVNWTDVAALPDGSSVTIATESVGGRNPIVKLDRDGALAWVKEFSKSVRHVEVLSDGTILASGLTTWIARLDADGNLLWSFDAQLGRSNFPGTRCILNDAAPIEQAPGVYDYVVVGWLPDGDACAFRVNADGTIPWQRMYIGDRVQNLVGVTTTRDGEIFAVGTNYLDYAGARNVPLAAKLDPATGDALFWKGMPMLRIAGLAEVTEGSDGTLFAAGNAFGSIYTTGASLVARFSPEGGDFRYALVLQDEDWEQQLGFEDWIDTAGGDVTTDVFTDIEPSGDGVVVVGTTGNGTLSATRAAKINANLGVDWITTMDTAFLLGESLHGVAPAEDGIFVSGVSASLPNPATGTTGEGMLWVTKLPLSGDVDLLPGLGMTTRQVAAGVRGPDLLLNPDLPRVIDIAITHGDTITVSAGPNAGLVVPASPYCVVPVTETGAISTLDACAD